MGSNQTYQLNPQIHIPDHNLLTHPNLPPLAAYILDKVTEEREQDLGGHQAKMTVMHFVHQ